MVFAVPCIILENDRLHPSGKSRGCIDTRKVIVTSSYRIVVRDDDYESHLAIIDYKMKDCHSFGTS